MRLASGRWGPRDPRSWLALGGIWLLAHPYAGIRHDAVYYAVDALYRLDPAVFGHDLLFIAGSPYKASIFGAVYAVVVDRLGTVPASWALFVLAQVLWGVAAVAWSARFVPAPIFAFASPALFLLPHWYDSAMVLRLAELHLTARSFAEPLTLLGVLAIAANAARAGAGALVVATAIHPIMALPGWIAGAWLLLGRLGFPLRARLAVIAVGLAAVLAAAASGVFGVVGDAWLETMRLRNPFILPSEWDAAYVARIGAPILVLLAVARRSGLRTAGLCEAVAIAALAGLVLTLIGESQRAALILQAQPWRTAWLAVWAAPFAALAAAWRFRRREPGRGLLFLGAVPAAALAFYAMVPAFPWLLAGHALTLHFERMPVVWLGRLGAAWLAVLTSSVLVAMSMTAYAVATRWDELSGGVSPHEFVAGQAGWLIGPVVVLLALRAYRRAGGGRVPDWIIGASLAVVVLSMLDARGDRVRAIEAQIASGLPELRAVIGEAQTVLWPESVALVWLALGRPSYVSFEQMSAQMFDPRLATEGRRRMALVGVLGGRDGLLAMRDAIGLSAPAPVADAGAVRRVCADRSSLAIVLDDPVAGIASAEVPTRPGKTVRVLRCDGIDGEGGAPPR